MNFLKNKSQELEQKQQLKDITEEHMAYVENITEYTDETPILWPSDGKNWLIWKHPDAGKDWRQEEKGMTEDGMVGWHHWLNGHELEQALGVGDGQKSLVCYSPWGCKESDMTERLNWTELTPYPSQPSLQHPESTQTHVHRVNDAIQPSHPLSSPSPPALSLSQHQGLFQWVSSSHQVAKVLEFQLQHQSFQWIFKTDFL